MTYLDSILMGSSSSASSIRSTNPTGEYASSGSYGNKENVSGHSFVLSEREAEAASPEAIAVCGEEDPGEGLEFLVADDSESEEADKK